MNGTYSMNVCMRGVCMRASVDIILALIWYFIVHQLVQIHYKIQQNKVLPVFVVGIDEDVYMALVADNAPGNSGPATEGGVRTSS